ncbi:hypothetical protein ACVILI_001165 [Mesorhizobium sp. USDA 4775]
MLLRLGYDRSGTGTPRWRQSGSHPSPQIVDQQPARWHCRNDCPYIGFVNGDGMGAIMRPAAEDLPGDQGKTERFLIRTLVDARQDRLLEACPPAFRRAICQNDPCVRIEVDQLTPIVRRGPVDAGCVAGQQLIPFWRRALGQSAPKPLLVFIGHDFVHVVTWAEAKDRQRLAHRVRSCPAKARSDHPYHHSSPDSGLLLSDQSLASSTRRRFPTGSVVSARRLAVNNIPVLHIIRAA